MLLYCYIQIFESPSVLKEGDAITPPSSTQMEPHIQPQAIGDGQLQVQDSIAQQSKPDRDLIYKRGASGYNTMITQSQMYLILICLQSQVPLLNKVLLKHN